MPFLRRQGGRLMNWLLDPRVFAMVAVLAALMMAALSIPEGDEW